jgi:hypothetical protein
MQKKKLSRIYIHNYCRFTQIIVIFLKFIRNTIEIINITCCSPPVSDICNILVWELNFSLM